LPAQNLKLRAVILQHILTHDGKMVLEGQGCQNYNAQIDFA
jgi:hypothetical protein